MRHTCFVLCILALVTVLLAPVVMFSSIFLIDAGLNAVVIALVVASWTYPITAAVGGIQGIRSWRKRDIKAQVKWTALAYSGIVVLLMGLLLVWFFCDGQLQCQKPDN